MKSACSGLTEKPLVLLLGKMGVEKAAVPCEFFEEVQPSKERINKDEEIGLCKQLC